MSAGTRDIILEQRASYRLHLTWTEPATVVEGVSVPGAPIDLTDADARLQIRSGPGGQLYVDLSDGDGITLGGATGTIDVFITPAQTAAIAAKRARYDLLISFFDRNEAVRVLEGKVTIVPAISVETETSNEPAP